MRSKLFVVFLVCAFLLCNVSVTSSDHGKDEIFSIITPVAIMERAPYLEGQKLSVIFSIKNKGNTPVFIDSITTAIVDESDEYSNSQWFRGILVDPDKSYHFKGDITFSKPGKYSLFICYKNQNGRWVKLNDPSSTLEIQVDSKSVLNDTESIILPNAYKGSYYGPVNMFLNDTVHDTIILPEGLKLSQDRYLSGVPSSSGEFTFEIDDKIYQIKIEENTDSLFDKGIISKDGNISLNLQEWEFPDIEKHWAKDTIMRMYSVGIIKGFPDGLFYPDEPVTRAELSTIICNALNILPDENNTCSFIDVEKHWACKFISEMSKHFIFIDDDTFDPDIPSNREETAAVIASAAGFNYLYTNPSILEDVFIDSEQISNSLRELIAQSYLKGVIRGYSDGSFSPHSKVTRAEVCAIIENILKQGVFSDILSSRPFDNQDDLVTNHVDENPVLENTSSQDFLATRGGSSPRLDARLLRELRLEYIFGKNSNGSYNTYKTKAEADANMVEIEITVWDFKPGTSEKITKTLKLTVNKKIAEDTKKIFNLIYEHEDKFPINSVVGYTWRAPYGPNNRISEHNYGTAIDINWADNPHVINGVVTTKGKWEPGINPYSIPADGSVVKIFKSFNWAWGGDAWGAHNRDYMHFSFLGN
ncbi:UNVERIFIED_CONTAM: S-layer family protein [Acetivibrio alkalicellulosi]